MYGLYLHFPQISSDSLQNWRLSGSNIFKNFPSSVAPVLPGRWTKNRLPRRKDGCFRVSGSARSRFLVPNVHVRSSVRSLRYLEAVGGYPGLIRGPDHPAANAEPCFCSEQARDSKSHHCRVQSPGMLVSMAEQVRATPRGIREA